MNQKMAHRVPAQIFRPAQKFRATQSRWLKSKQAAQQQQQQKSITERKSKDVSASN